MFDKKFVNCHCMRLLVQGEKLGKTFSNNYKAELNKPCAMFFFSKNCLLSRTYVVSLIAGEYLLLFCLFFSIIALSRLNKLIEL